MKTSHICLEIEYGTCDGKKSSFLLSETSGMVVMSVEGNHPGVEWDTFPEVVYLSDFESSADDAEAFIEEVDEEVTLVVDKGTSSDVSDAVNFQGVGMSALTSKLISSGSGLCAAVNGVTLNMKESWTGESVGSESNCLATENLEANAPSKVNVHSVENLGDRMHVHRAPVESGESPDEDEDSISDYESLIDKDGGESLFEEEATVKVEMASEVEYAEAEVLSTCSDDSLWVGWDTGRDCDDFPPPNVSPSAWRARDVPDISPVDATRACSLVLRNLRLDDEPQEELSPTPLTASKTAEVHSVGQPRQVDSTVEALKAGISSKFKDITFKHALNRDQPQGKVKKSSTHMRLRSVTHSGAQTFQTRKKADKYRCAECGKHFRLKQYLRVHMTKHVGAAKSRCNLCGAAFASKSALSQHKLKEHNFRFKCEHCPLTFRRSDNLSVHEMLHTGENPFTCSVCRTSFRTKYKLTRHFVTHTGARPFTCSVCDASFYRSDHFKRHSKIHERKKTEKAQKKQ